MSFRETEIRTGALSAGPCACLLRMAASRHRWLAYHAVVHLMVVHAPG